MQVLSIATKLLKYTLTSNIKKHNDEMLYTGFGNFVRGMPVT